MKRQIGRESFINQLKRALRTLRHIKSNEVHVLNINASYGHYQIVIGPKNKNLHQGKGQESRPIEIHGEIHHLFLSPHTVRTMPSQRQMMANMRDTVIARDLSIHIHDPKGDGRHVSEPDADVHAREYLNLAGSKGEQIVQEANKKKHLIMMAYKIAQLDILKTLSRRKKKEEILTTT